LGFGLGGDCGWFYSSNASGAIESGGSDARKVRHLRIGVKVTLY
jgi:hypothetical protein